MLSLGIGVNGRKNVSLYDANALAFINATGLTGTTEKTAVNNLVKNLKSYGLWSKMKAIYPFVSDTYNLASYTEDFTNAVWTTLNCSVTANQTTAPNGTTTADKLIENSSAGFHGVLQLVTGTVGQTYTFSCYLKAAERTWALMWFDADGAGAYVNLSDGSLGTVSAGVTASVESVGNGWYRAKVTKTISTGANIRVFSASGNGGVNYTGNGTSGIFMWGAQMELSSTANTYQPIATTPANRFVSQFKYNLKDARDLDAAFRLAFNGTWTYSKQGATPNGVNGFANTYLVPSSALIQDNSHISYYSRTDISALQVDMGAHVTAPNRFSMEIRYNGNFSSDQYNYNTGRVATTSSSSLGLFASSRISSSSHKGYRNGVQIGSTNTGASDSISNINISMYLGAANNSTFYSSKQVAFSTIGNGLTDTEATNLYTSVQLFQQELSRYVGVPIVSDANAQAFLDAAVITDQTQANAVNTLVTDLKTYGLWTKMKAIYPFVGGTATTHKWNLKDPRDLDAAYRLAFSGAWTHSSTGALPNGANAYADTYFIPNNALTLNSSHLGFYSRTNSTTGVDDFSAVIVGDLADMRIIINEANVLKADMNSYLERITGTNTSSTGLYQVSRISSTSLKVYKNNTTFGTNTAANTGTLPAISMYMGAAHRGTSAINYSNRECAFATLGDGLSDTEAANLYTAVNKFQTSLSRNV